MTLDELIERLRVLRPGRGELPVSIAGADGWVEPVLDVGLDGQEVIVLGDVPFSLPESEASE